MSTVFRILLLIGLLVCAVATALVKKPMRAVIIYMAYSIIMSVVWLLLESPDLAITDGGNVDYTKLSYFDPILELKK